MNNKEKKKKYKNKKKMKYLNNKWNNLENKNLYSKFNRENIKRK